jgi:ubiquinone/menaquinone biosynthesis C-methylase UbiE
MISRRPFLLAPVIPFLRGQESKMFGNATQYERFMGRWSRLVAPRLVDFAAGPDSGRMLDVGSGTGSLSNAIAQRKPRMRVVGIDPSTEYVAYANSQNSSADRVTFQVGDAQQLSFPDASFDASLSLLVFNFIPDARKALSEVRRVTKPGGPIAAAVWDYGAGMRMLRVFWDAVVATDPAAEKLDEKHMKLCRAGELTDLWKQGGLENVREQPIDVTTKFASFADYWDPFLLGQGPAGVYATRLNPERREALRTDLKRRLAVSSEAAPVELTARVWAVRGTVPKAG